jgi:hypothetical protein
MMLSEPRARLPARQATAALVLGSIAIVLSTPCLTLLAFVLPASATEWLPLVLPTQLLGLCFYLAPVFALVGIAVAASGLALGIASLLGRRGIRRSVSGVVLAATATAFCLVPVIGTVLSLSGAMSPAS